MDDDAMIMNVERDREGVPRVGWCTVLVPNCTCLVSRTKTSEKHNTSNQVLMVPSFFCLLLPREMKMILKNGFLRGLSNRSN